MYNDAIELCPGIGMMGEGITSCGIQIRATNDKQAELCKFQTRQGQANVITGDISLHMFWQASMQHMAVHHLFLEDSAVNRGPNLETRKDSKIPGQIAW